MLPRQGACDIRIHPHMSYIIHKRRVLLQRTVYAEVQTTVTTVRSTASIEIGMYKSSKIMRVCQCSSLPLAVRRRRRRRLAVARAVCRGPRGPLVRRRLLHLGLLRLRRQLAQPHLASRHVGQVREGRVAAERVPRGGGGGEERGEERCVKRGDGAEGRRRSTDVRGEMAVASPTRSTVPKAGVRLKVRVRSPFDSDMSPSEDGNWDEGRRRAEWRL